MKYYTFIGLILLTLSSCSIKKLTQQYVNNHDICYRRLFGTLISTPKPFDVSKLDFRNVNMATSDTLINNKDTLKTWEYTVNKDFTITTTNKNTYLKTIAYYSHTGRLKREVLYLIGKESGLTKIGVSFYFGNQVNEYGEPILDFLYTGFNLDSLAPATDEGYPICFEEALDLIKAKIGKYDLLRLCRGIKNEPNKQGMQYYWSIKTKQRWRKPKYFYVDAINGKIAKVNEDDLESCDDQLY